MIDIEILRRRAKRGISFTKQTPQFVELFGVRSLHQSSTDERQKKRIYGYGFIVERSELLARRCLLLEDKAVRIIEKGLWI